MIKQKCTRLERCEVNLQHKKYRGIWLAGVKFFERDEPREELLEYSTFYGVVHCLVVCLVHCVVRRNTVRSTLLFEVRIVQSGYWNVLKSLVVIWSRFYAVCVGWLAFITTVVVVPVVNRGYLWMKLNGIMIIHDSREDKKQF